MILIADLKCLIFPTVTVYTQFGYAMVDLDKYREETDVSSPDKSHDSAGSLASTSSSGPSAGEKIIEVQYRWGLGYIQVSKCLLSI